MPMVRNWSLYSHDQLKIETSDTNRYSSDQSAEPGGDREAMRWVGRTMRVT